MNVFYTSDVEWFGNVANGLIWAIILAFVGFLVWLGYDMITGPRRQRAEVARMLEGLETSNTVISSHKIDKPAEIKKSPFAPDQDKRRKLTAKF